MFLEETSYIKNHNKILFPIPFNFFYFFLWLSQYCFTLEEFTFHACKTIACRGLVLTRSVNSNIFIIYIFII